MNDLNSERKELDAKLRSILGSSNSYVYFQPPENYKMKYPCIVYNLGTPRVLFANDKQYIKKRRYEITYIHDDPVSPITDIIHEAFRYCRFERRFVSDNKYHDVFTVFYDGGINNA